MTIQVTIKVEDAEQTTVCELDALSDAVAKSLIELGYPQKQLTGIHIKT